MEKIKRIVYTIPEMAEALGLGRNTAYELVKKKGFPTVRIGGSVRIPIDALNKWLSNRQAMATTTMMINI